MTPVEVIAQQRDALAEAWRVLVEAREQIANLQEALDTAADEYRELRTENDELRTENDELSGRVEELEEKLAAVPGDLVTLCHEVLREFGAAREDYPRECVTNAWVRDVEEAIRRAGYEGVD